MMPLLSEVKDEVEPARHEPEDIELELRQSLYDTERA